MVEPTVRSNKSLPGRLEDILVVSDMDGTLLTPDQKLLPGVLETVRLFVMLGGRFTVATGRTVGSIMMYPQLAQLIQPAITSGGCVVYDLHRDMAVKSAVLPPLVAQNAMQAILGAFPALGAMVMGNDMRLYQVASSVQLDKLISDEKMTYYARPDEDLPELWNKVLFAGPPQMLAAVREYTEAQNYGGVHFVSTTAIYYEMMPEGVGKGSALRELTSLLQVPLEHTVVIGDYYNDLDMMQEAGYAVAMGNAPAEVRRRADEVTGGNRFAGAAEFLYKLIKRYEDE